MKTRNYTGTALYYIDYFNPKTGKLSDISEEGYATLELCQVQIDAEKKEDEEILQELDAKHEQELTNFILDLDITDRPPVNPRKFYINYIKLPHRYIYDENGHHEITEHCINDLHLLNASGGQIHKINSILNGTLDPETFQSVQSWVSQCFNRPSAEEMQLHAINQILEGYGIESLRTTKWKNGYWCDILCTYVNMGDSYVSTLIHHRKHGFMVGCIGDIAEKNKHVI
jgi:hypothetical protein